MSSRLSDRIRAARKYMGLSASQAADLTGLTRKSWERYELDKNEPRATSLAMLVEHGIDGNWLLTGKGNMTTPNPQNTQPVLDHDLLKLTIKELENFREQNGPDWSNEQIARIIALGYQMLAAEKQKGNTPEAGNLRFLMQAALL
ncbi:helix-turn-helix transcriptional regulator [uncultured Thalassospira sp.]|jgi:transcriptional regulator with XRE-family HTH domain|uniref:helix-turn-helix domain-containing protein n=1 Tax=uncultured Thalassospira sp. TaxID=404382 RepID=UPI0030D99822|tara:strand:+ start:5347 stop:5781 length:435 start_codon:yes stop_codon:yes gene_type:complete